MRTYIAEKVNPFEDRAKSLYETRKKDESKALEMMKTDYKLNRPRAPNKTENNFQVKDTHIHTHWCDSLDNMTRAQVASQQIKKRR